MFEMSQTLKRRLKCPKLGDVWNVFSYRRDLRRPFLLLKISFPGKTYIYTIHPWSAPAADPSSLACSPPPASTAKGFWDWSNSMHFWSFHREWILNMISMINTLSMRYKRQAIRETTFETTGCPKVRVKINHPLNFGIGRRILKPIGIVNAHTVRVDLLYHTYL